MAGWNGSGVFQRVYSWVADAAAGIDISSSRMDTDTDNITTNGFGNCLTRDGQGAASANLPMNGFRHTGVGNGIAATDYAAIGQLQAPGTPAATPLIPAGAYLGEIRETTLPESLLATLMPGWHVASGGTRPRTDPLWQATGQVSSANWVFGNGDGTTTYTLPDRRGRTVIGKDDMGGTPANRVTTAVSNVNGVALGASGGDQHAQADTIATTLGGSITAASSATSTPTDPGHTHTTSTGAPTNLPLLTAGGANNNGVVGSGATTGSATTGITVATSVTTTITNALTVSSASSLTGASQNMMPGLVENIVIFCGA